MAKGTGTYDDPIICDGIFSKTIDGVKKFFKLNNNKDKINELQKKIITPFSPFCTSSELMDITGTFLPPTKENPFPAIGEVVVPYDCFMCAYITSNEYTMFKFATVEGNKSGALCSCPREATTQFMIGQFAKKGNIIKLIYDIPQDKTLELKGGLTIYYHALLSA